MVHDHSSQRTRRFGAQDVLAALREAFSQRPGWLEFSLHQLSVLLFLNGYLSTPPTDFDVETALPFALEDWEGAA
jgi:hypothetical protein